MSLPPEICTTVVPTRQLMDISGQVHQQWPDSNQCHARPNMSCFSQAHELAPHSTNFGRAKVVHILPSLREASKIRTSFGRTHVPRAQILILGAIVQHLSFHWANLNLTFSPQPATSNRQPCCPTAPLATVSHSLARCCRRQSQMLANYSLLEGSARLRVRPWKVESKLVVGQSSAS